MKTKTISLSQNGQGIQYAKVSARLAEFIKLNKNSSVRTRYEFVGEMVVFKASIIPEVTNLLHRFNGTSMGKIGGVKAFEKLETIAVGRALAFAGFLSDGEIASEEEMQKVGIESPITVAVDPSVKLVFKAKLESAESEAELKKVWSATPIKIKKELKPLLDELKKKYADA